MAKPVALLAAAVCLLATISSSRADPSATVVVPDRLCFPGEEIHIEAYLYRRGPLGFFQMGIQGELLRFLDPEGNPLRDLLTDPSGMARIRYTAGPPGRYPITVRLIDNPRHRALPSTGNFFVQKKGVPLLFVTVETGLMRSGSAPFLPRDPQKLEAEPGSAEALSDIASCHLPVYLTQRPKPSLHQVRSWLEGKGYPPGPIYILERSWMAGTLSEAPKPETGLLESLWKERSDPAHLVTRDPGLARAAADNEITVLLLTGGTKTPGSPKEQEKKGVTTVESWTVIPSLCRCEIEGSEQTPSRKD